MNHTELRALRRLWEDGVTDGEDTYHWTPDPGQGDEPEAGVERMTAREMALTPHELRHGGNLAVTRDGSRYEWTGGHWERLLEVQ